MIDLNGYTFPTSFPATANMGDGIMAFPQMVEFDTEGEVVVHPVRNVLADGGVIESLRVHDECWTEDGQVCINATMTVSGRKYGISFWNLTFHKVADMVRNENSLRALHILKHELLDEATDY